MVSNASATREAAADARDDAKRASENVQADLDALREDVANLARRLSDLLSSKSSSALQQAKSGMDETIARVEQKARDTGDDVTDAINDALKTRPLTTLAVVAGLGFVLGAIWRR